jgi:hypothetical protein
MTEKKSGLNDTARLHLHNRSKNIIRLDGFVDAEGNALVVGVEADRGLIGAPQPVVSVTAGELRKMSAHPAIDAMLNDPNCLEAKQPFSL